MDARELERIIIEEVKKALAEQQRGESTLLPPSAAETIDANACKSPACSCSCGGETVESKSGAAAPAPSPLDGPAVLLILTGAREPWDIHQKTFRLWREEGVTIEAIFSADAPGAFTEAELNGLGIRLIKCKDEIQALRLDMSRYAAVYMPSVCRNHAAKLALAITDDHALKVNLAALAHKVPTIASTEGLAKDACIVFGNNVPGVQEVLDGYRNQLSKMGVKLLPAPDALKETHRAATNKADSESPDLITYIITEEDADKLKGPVVKAVRGGLITPLAMEKLTRRGIEVVIVPQK
ncbi:MAG: hypothetical protein GC154_06275 [bacterium]|nr:hypothetical protein [bacterium]